MTNFNAVHPACLEFVRTIDTLLDRRYKEAEQGTRTRSYWQYGREPGPRRWTYSHFRSSVYTSYPSVLRGQTQSPPLRSDVMHIADYLECTVDERNRLLHAAGYPLVPPYLTGVLLDDVLRIGADVARFLQMPSYVITRDWDIHFANHYLLRLLGLSSAQFEAIPPKLRNIIQVIFDSALPAYASLSVNPNNWRYIAKRNVYGFKSTNLFCEFEDWYQERVERWCCLLTEGEPLFRTYWNEVQLDSQIAHADERVPFPFYTTDMRVTTGEIVRFRSLLTSLGNYDYPQVVSYIPADHASCRAFERLGIPIPPDWAPEEQAYLSAA